MNENDFFVNFSLDSKYEEPKYNNLCIIYRIID